MTRRSITSGDRMAVAIAAARTRNAPWQSRSACADVDPELFHLVSEDGPGAAHQIAEAKAVCAGCPVRQQCSLWASEAPDGQATARDLIVAGLTPGERRRMAANATRARSRATALVASAS